MNDALLRTSLKKLAADPTSADNARLWRAMAARDREKALLSAFADPDERSAVHESAIVTIAKARGFRIQSILLWTDPKVAEWAARVDSLPAGAAWKAIVALHVQQRLPMLAAFLDAVGIAHDGGHFIDDEPPLEPVDASVLYAAASSLATEHEINEVALYLLALRINFGEAFVHLDGWLAELAEGTPSVPEPVAEEQAIVPVISGGDLTVLDRRVVRTIVDAAAGVVGAESEDQIDDLVLEMEQLNGSRHSTFFHSGFRDALFDRAARVELPAENEGRRRWYWAGFVTGLARRNRWEGIIACFETDHMVRALGGHGDGPARLAAPLVFQALTRAERIGEATSFSTVAAVMASGELKSLMLLCAVDLIRHSRAAEALSLLDVLLAAVTNGSDENDEFLVEVQRRRALCLRQLGEQREALDILHGLASSSDPVVSAIAHTDIGLIAAGFRRLGDIRLPADRSQLTALVEALERGEERWTKAAATPGFSPAHANFALGVLALARAHYDEADHRLSAAESVFSSRPAIYVTDGSLALAHLYLGMAICLTLRDPGRLGRAGELLEEGMRAGAQLPRWLISTTVDALGMQNGDLAREAALLILTHAGDETLDDLIASASAATIPAIRPALFQRAANPSRPDTRRAADYRVVLPWLIAGHEVDKARDALEFLEVAAGTGIGRNEFLALLHDDLTPAWNAERVADAHVHLLELQGKFAEAAFIVETAAYALLTDGSDPSALDNAELLLLVLEGYGAGGAESYARVRAVVEPRLAQRDREERELLTCSIDDGPTCQVHIVVVGGNEVQRRMDSDISARVSAELPGVSVSFLHTGWNSNWSPYVDQFDTRKANSDGVVLLQLMRTTFGRTIRARCHLPWRGCRGRGQGEIFEAIRRVVPMSRARLLAQGGAGYVVGAPA